MGFTPADVNAMSLAQFLAAAQGYARANSAGPKTTITEDDMRRWMEEG